MEQTYTAIPTVEGSGAHPLFDTSIMDSPDGLTPAERQAAQALDALAEANHEMESIQQAIVEKTTALIPLGLRQQIAEIERSFVAQITQAQAAIKKHEGLARTLTMGIKHTVKGQELQCVYMKGSAKWNDDWLMGYARARPEVMAARSVGDPKTAIRKLGSKEGSE